MKKLILFLSIISFFGNNNNLSAQDDDKIYEMNEVDKKAEFYGGYKELMRFIKDNYEFPKEFIRMGIDGKRVIEFIVEKDGSLSNIKAFIKNPLINENDENMVIAIKKSPKWIPAMNNDKIVRSKIKIPIVCMKIGH